MKQIIKVILTAAALVVFAVPAIAANKLVVKDSAGTSNVLTVTDDGKVGIGTDAPFADLQSTSTSTTNGYRGLTALQISDGNPGAVITFMKASGNPTVKTQPTDNNYLGTFGAQFYNSQTSAFERSAQFGFRNDATSSPGVYPTGIVFFTGSRTTAPSDMTEKMRISSSGNVIVGNLGGTATADLTATVTNGFLYVPNVAGALTSCATATVVTGHSPIWYDTTNNKICTCRASALKCTTALN